MYLHVSTVKRKSKVYRYAQLVECYRREKDGMPAHRVLANLGALSEQQVANFRVALAASRKGRTVVVPQAPEQRPAAHAVLDNLRYLDIAVALAMWRHWKLDELLEELMPRGRRDISPSDVVAALTLHRCVAPGSKLSAQRWFPRTALPELLGVAPGQFNNTRLHEVLSLLEKATPELQRRLPQRFVSQQGAFTALFVDVTDTWFVGNGPLLAEKNKTKEGLYRKKIGIVLMCNQDGYPLRWEVVPGRRHDSKTMSALIDALEKVGWLGEAPLVCDRAMGKTAQLKWLLQTGHRFLTALLKDEYEAYAKSIPHHALDTVDASADDAVDQAARAVEAVGLKRVKDDLYVLDLGLVERDDPPGDSTAHQRKAVLDRTDKPRQVLERVRRIRADLDSGTASTYADAGRTVGWSKTRVATLLKLLELPDDLQEEIMAGRAARLSLNFLLRLVALCDPEQQRAVFDQELAAARDRPAGVAGRVPKRGAKEMARRGGAEKPEAVRLRAVLCFNPFQFVDQRRATDRLLGEIHTFVRDLNESLAAPRSRLHEASIYAKVDQELRRRGLLSAFEIDIRAKQHKKRKRLTLELRRKPQQWQRLQRYDGFNLLAAHPDSPQDGTELAQLYRAKDRVEKDFQTIKSVLEIRPVRHRTDVKVRAHVTLCMLALLLERTLERNLAASAAGEMTAEMAFEKLSSTHLNRLQADGTDGASTPVYTVTRPTLDQLAILRGLDQTALVDDEQVADRITAR